MNSSNSRTAALAAAILVLATFGTACSSSGGKGGSVGAPPASFAGFPQQAVAGGIVIAEAKLYTNYEAIFGSDLIDDEDVIPVSLKIGLKGQGQEISRVNLTSQGTDWRLYLQDGTALQSVPYEKVAAGSKKVAERVTARALKLTLLGKWDDAKEGFVFFKLAPPGDFSVKGANINHRDGDTLRQLDLARSLVSFTVRMENDDLPVFVGLQRDVAAKGN
jgi:hypothetical protein